MVAEGGGKFPLRGQGGFVRKDENGLTNPERPHLLYVQDPNKSDSDIVSDVLCV